MANDPAKGHQFRFYTTRLSRGLGSARGEGLKCKGERLSTSHARDRADQDLDNHFFDRFADELSKSTVWTAKALSAKEPCRSSSCVAPAQFGKVPSRHPRCREGSCGFSPHQDQLRQRVAWALSQIFVVSANGFGMDDRTELWLNYYDPRLPRLSLHMPA